MGFSTYAALLRLARVRRTLLLAWTIRVPMVAAYVAVTLHVVLDMHRSYAQAGLVDAVMAIAMAISGPWRGRLLDRVGLRRTLAPSLVVLTMCWCVAPWVGYWVLLAIMGLAGLFVLPTNSIVRQVLITAVEDVQRPAVLSVDSVAMEISFMAGPVVGVLLATWFGPAVGMLVCQLAGVVGGLVLMLDDPPLRTDTAEPAGGRMRDWMGPSVLGILLLAATATFLLNGEDLGVVAALRHMQHREWIGWVLAVWAGGSALGGTAYGALRRHPPAWTLMGTLALTTGGCALATQPVVFVVLLFLSGVFCAPTITATIDELATAVPLGARGEAMGWHSSALTVGGAVGGPLVGAAMDGAGWHAGFGLAGVVGVVGALAAAAAVVLLAARRPVPTRPSGDV